jgi:hypothetical protein
MAGQKNSLLILWHCRVEEPYQTCMNYRSWSKLWASTVVLHLLSAISHMANDAYTQCPQPWVGLGLQVIPGYQLGTQQIFLPLKKEC